MKKKLGLMVAASCLIAGASAHAGTVYEQKMDGYDENVAHLRLSMTGDTLMVTNIPVSSGNASVLMTVDFSSPIPSGHIEYTSGNGLASAVSDQLLQVNSSDTMNPVFAFSLTSVTGVMSGTYAGASPLSIGSLVIFQLHLDDEVSPFPDGLDGLTPFSPADFTEAQAVVSSVPLPASAVGGSVLFGALALAGLRKRL